MTTTRSVTEDHHGATTGRWGTTSSRSPGGGVAGVGGLGAVSPLAQAALVGRQALLQVSVISRMVPLVVLMVPLYVLFRRYDLLNSLAGVVVASSAGAGLPDVAVINNVESIAVAPDILRRGAAWFASLV